MFAYVKYEDKYNAILPISLVKTFSPKSKDDFDRTKKVQVFWRSDDGEIQGYYPAFVCALAEVARATAERQEGQVIAEFTLPSSLDAGTGLPKEMVEDVRDADIDGDATCLLPGSVVSDCSASIGIEVTHLEDYNGSFAPCDQNRPQHIYAA
ncbi:hypothetical protein MTO96_039061 [Rhipicephalus appendiculatus]